MKLSNIFNRQNLLLAKDYTKSLAKGIAIGVTPTIITLAIIAAANFHSYNEPISIDTSLPQNDMVTEVTDCSPCLYPLETMLNGGVINDRSFILAYNADHDGAYNQAIGQITETVLKDAKDSSWLFPEEDEDWSLNDRKIFEEWIFEQIRMKLDEIPALSSENYRNQLQDENIVRYDVINNLSHDIGKTDPSDFTAEWDCEMQSFTIGLIAQKIETQLFAELNPDGIDLLMQAGNYHYVSGVLDSTEHNSYDVPVGHAFLISEISSSIIEGTASGNHSYFSPISPLYSFDDFIDGTPFFNKNGHTYSGYEIVTRDDLHQAQKAAIAQMLDDVDYMVGEAQRVIAVAENDPILTDLTQNIREILTPDHLDSQGHYAIGAPSVDFIVEQASIARAEQLNNPDYHLIIQGEPYIAADLLREADDIIYDLGQLKGILKDHPELTKRIEQTAHNLIDTGQDITGSTVHSFTVSYTDDRVTYFSITNGAERTIEDNRIFEQMMADQSQHTEIMRTRLAQNNTP